MHTEKTPAAGAPIAAVPMLDVRRENARLQAELDAAMAEVSQSGAFVHGPACAKFEAAMAAYCGTQHAVGCASGSDALLLSLMALGVGPGDEVIVPSFTFFATASAVWRLGAKPVFADILPETFNLDPADVLYKITSDTKAIIPVHLFGQCAAMKEIRQIATAARGIPIIEDACQAIGAEYQGCAGRLARYRRLLQLLSDQEPGRVWRWRAHHDQRCRAGGKAAGAARPRSAAAVLPSFCGTQQPARYAAGGGAQREAAEVG